MKVSLIYAPENRERMLFKRAVWTTMGKTGVPKELPSSELLRGVLNAKHSPCRVLQFCFLIEDIPSNTSTHLARHVHAVPFVSSLRNDRQKKIDGDAARRDTPVNMLYYLNAEELMNVAHKRLCSKAAQRTQEVVRMMCSEAIKVMPELEGLLVPACEYNGGVCHEIQPCWRCQNKR